MKIEINILSYNRPKQLERVFENFLGYSNSKIEVCVCDDNSPKIKEIEEIFIKYSSLLKIKLKLKKNKENLGYDLNLISAIQNSKSDYVLLLSDDDYIKTDNLNTLINEIEINQKDFFILPYYEKNKWNRTLSSKIPSSDFIYNTILFSGLIFKPRLVKDLDFSFLKNSIYSQVYLSFYYSCFGKCAYLNSKILYVGADGENFFGKNESSDDKSLMDRTDLLSNYKYQKKLLSIIQIIDNNLCKGIYFTFMKEYRLRLLAMIIRLRSKTNMTSFNNIMMKEKIINKNLFLNSFLSIMLSIIPKQFAKLIYTFGIKKLKKSG